METLRLILKVVFVIVSVVLTVIVLLQEGKSAGLGAIAGGNSDTYWGRNKSRSKEGRIVIATRILAIVFIVLAVVLNLNVL